MKKYRAAVSALVLKGSEILLVHKPRRMDAWQLPQGGIEDGETAEQAAKRELFEEAGIRATETLSCSKQTFRYDFPPEFIARVKPVNDGQTLCFVVFRAPPDANVTCDKREVDDYAWVTREKLGDFIKRKEYLDVILAVLAEL